MNLKKLYLEYFEKLGHTKIPSAPLIPENDPSVLFNTAGMQPLIPYIMGEPHPFGKRLCDVQKCVRLTDLESVGDLTHHTFFEMLGNWSLGDYFKEESITYSFNFLTQVLNIPISHLAVTVYQGDAKIKRDDVSANCWLKLGIPKQRIAYLGKDDNFWIPGDSGPCGGDTEIFYWRSNEVPPQEFNPTDDRWVEIWNNVFIEYYQDKDGNVKELQQKNVDTGMGVERTLAILEGKTDNYLSSLWVEPKEYLEKITNLNYEENAQSMRIILDHYRTAVFIAADPAGIKPSNTDQGYILRRLIRRAIRHARKLNINLNSDWDTSLAKIYIQKYHNDYPELKENAEVVLEVLKIEKEKFNRTLEKGLKIFEKLTKNLQNVDGLTAFHLYDTYGFPIELTVEVAKEQNMTVDIEGFKKHFLEHQEKSRTASKGKFTGGLSGDGIIQTKYHTATHLLNAALRQVIGPDVHQKGSNITPERLRFDFSCDHKLTEEEKQQVENLVNTWIKEGLTVNKKTMPKQEAIASKAECMFIEKYPDIVTVYEIGDVSRELCGGPHVNNTSELGTFKIIKEEASSSGVRRIKAILE